MDTHRKFSSLAFVTATLLISACATPPGKMKDTDFVVRRVEIQQSVQLTVSAFYEGLRYCGPRSGQGVIFVTPHGIPDCGPVRPDGVVVCDLYMDLVSGGARSNVILGRADFVPATEGTEVFLRVEKSYLNKVNILNDWQEFLLGRAQKVCPEK
ncbi:MAG: hypothetical protein P8O76_03695 [Methylophilaceae bacterium]|nr:hypothetical protein [Methylophilaceae bacterium]